MMNLVSFFNKKNLKKYNKILKKIRNLEEFYYKDIIESEFSNKLLEIRNSNHLKQSEKVMHSIALAGLAAQKTLNMSYYDVQIIGALALIDGCIAEMKTGEGKTLTCTAAVAANFATGHKTHVATANDYLAERDQKIMKPLYDLLGINSAYNVSTMNKEDKAISYRSEVVYSTAQEFGFDFLKDNLVSNFKEKIQPELSEVKAIIDEADFILIDEARTPLIISGESPIKNLNTYHTIREVAKTLTMMAEKPEEKYLEKQKYIPGDFWVEDKYKTVHLSEEGFEKLEKIFSEVNLIEKDYGITLYNHNNGWLIHETLNALKAEYNYIREKDYTVIDNEIVIIDQNTGRLSDGRTWSNGLHQAIEAKEGLNINPETMTLGTISIQNYFRNYKNIAGMSGTIMTSSLEFQEIYNTTTIRIPTNKKMIRNDKNDKIFITKKAKYNELMRIVVEKHTKGQPILIGTTSVKESEEVSELLAIKKIKHNVLNAKNHHREAQIISQAGKPFAVTVSTSMAGRGTDIILGGNRDEMIKIINELKNSLNERIAYIKMIEQQMLSQDIFPEETTVLEFEEVESDHLHDIILSLYNPENIVNLLNLGLENAYRYIDKLSHKCSEELHIINSEQALWRNKVIEAGGLCVIGSSRNESRRIDDQLRGRAGRQGDPGESIYLISLEDDWVSHLNRNPVFQHLIKTLPENEAIESNLITKAIFKAQAGIEGHHYSSRKSTFQYDSVADEGRRQFLKFRNLLIKEQETIKHFLANTIHDSLTPLTSEIIFEEIEEPLIDKEHIEIIKHYLNKGLEYSIMKSKEISSKPHYFEIVKCSEKYEEIFSKFILELISEISNEEWGEISQKAIDKLDKKWAEHLLFVEDARQNVAFSGMAQKNPLQEFKKLCFDSFNKTFNEFGLDIIEIIISNKDTNVFKHISIDADNTTNNSDKFVELSLT